MTSPLDYSEIAKAQQNDEQLKSLLKSENLKFKAFFYPESNKPIYCEISTHTARPYLPRQFRVTAFQAIHGISHSGTRCTRKMIANRYFWKSMNRDITNWTRACLDCQKSKIQRHTTSPLQSFPKSDRFRHLNIDIVGPLSYCKGYKYILTMIDRATGWPEAVPLKDITAETVAEKVYTHWITRFGSPNYWTVDQGRQFTSHLFSCLAKRLGVTKIHCTAYHPQANGKIERWHRSLKAALMARGNTENWVSELPTVLLGLRASLRDDTEISAAELVYGTPLTLPGEFFEPSQQTSPDNEQFVHELRDHIRKLCAVPKRPNRQNNIFVHPELKSCTHVFVRCDHVTKPLTQPYSGPYKVIEQHDKYFKLLINDNIKTVSIDRLKPAFFIHNDSETRYVRPNKSNEMQTDLSSDNLSTKNNNTPNTEKRTRYGRLIKPTVRFMQQ